MLNFSTNSESAPTNGFPRNTTTKSDVQWLFDIESAGWAVRCPMSDNDVASDFFTIRSHS